MPKTTIVMNVARIGKPVLLIRMFGLTALLRWCRVSFHRLRVILRLRSLDTKDESFDDWSDRQW
jgi:hypothetical protein